MAIMKPHKQAGVAAVELAVIFIPMLILCLGITELGRALYQYDGVVKATRGAARYLTQQNLNDTVSYDAAVKIAQSMAVCGKLPPALGQVYSPCAASDPIFVPGLDRESQVTVTNYPNVPTGAGTVSLVSVKIGDDSTQAVRFMSMFPIPGSMIDSFSFAPVTITLSYSAS